MENLRYDRVELRPAYERQAYEIFHAYELAWKQGGWTIYNDEEWYLEQELGLEHAINKLLTQGSGKGISMCMSAQRPSRISRFVLSQAHHVLSFGIEGRDAKIIAEATSPRLVPVVTSLRKYEFAWFNRATRQVWRGRMNIKTGGLEGEVVRVKE